MADQIFKYIIIGRGMMGAAAARHLGAQSDGVALIGPDEPVDKVHHDGVFASHYDEARITRTIDGNPVWAKLANRSIARYREMEKDSGVDFYHEVGCLIVAPKPGGQSSYIARVAEAALQVGVATEDFDGAALASAFPYFQFEAGCVGIFERENAGYVNPRAMVKAQTVLAQKAGVALINSVAIAVRDEGSYASVATADGQVVKGEKVLVAAGGFSIAPDLLPQKFDLSINARTVAFFEIPDEELSNYAGIPSLIYEPTGPEDHIYLLPPVRYPDGKTYLKIGGDPDDLKLLSEPDIRAWFKCGGREFACDHLTLILHSLVPELRHAPVTMAPCVTSFTPSGYPAIGYSQSSRIGVLSGGCGASAKSSDEIGRLGAVLLQQGSLEGEDYPAVFAPCFS